MTVWRRVGLELESRNIGLSYYNYADDAVVIIADPEQLSRVIHNIIGNSLKYLDKPQGYYQYPHQGRGRFYPGGDRGQRKGNCSERSAVHF